MNIKKVLVIGGAGYIGAHVVDSLFGQGFLVTVFDNLSTGRKEHLPSRIELIVGTILDKDALSKAFTKVKPDAVIHLAALKAAGESMTEVAYTYSDNNIVGTINILDIMINKKIPYFVFSSSAAVYGDPQYLPLDEEHIKNPINYYGVTKSIIEEILKWYSQIYEFFNYSALRYFNAAGHMDSSKINVIEPNPQNLIPIVLEAAKGKRKKLQIFGNDYNTPDGTCVRDYIHVSDLAEAHVLSLKYLESHEDSLILNLGTGRGFSVSEVYNIACKVTGKEIPVEYVDRREGDMGSLYAKSILAYKKIQWKAQHTDLESILESAWKSYLKQI